jgi:chloramphenicol 3-O phosphotransferase
MLQGPSSSGKSTLARALQTTLDEYWWALEADDITRMQPTWQIGSFWNPAPEEKTHPSWNEDRRLEAWLAGYFGCLATIAKTGSNVMAVGGWLKTSWLLDLADAMDGIDAYCVGVFCPLEELERREAERGDRGIGYARSQYVDAQSHRPYDIEIDTSRISTDDAADRVKAMLANPPSDPFFARIRRTRGV